MLVGKYTYPRPKWSGERFNLLLWPSTCIVSKGRNPVEFGLSMVCAACSWRIRYSFLLICSSLLVSGSERLFLASNHALFAMDFSHRSPLKINTKSSSNLSEDLFRAPHVAVYLYESGSPFEKIMNQYMITGKGINPFDPRGNGIEGIALNVTVAGATLGANAVLSAA